MSILFIVFAFYNHPIGEIIFFLDQVTFLSGKKMTVMPKAFQLSNHFLDY